MHHHVLRHAKSVALAGLLAVAVASAANAQKKYDPGATDTEIKVGNIMPYSGPLSAYATIGKTEAAYFKKVNDGFGHLAGDYVLKHLAQTVRAKIRREDCFARYGGEEFAIVLPEIDAANAVPFAEKIRQIVEKTEFKFENTRIPVTISMGVAAIDAELTEAAALIKRADERLYEAKASGRNRVCA